MKIGTHYRQKHVQGKYNALIIGSGLGSLAAAAVLSKAGKRVLVLERHYMAGGFTHVYQRRGFEWDVGLHYIGEVHKPHNPMRKAFDYVTDGKLLFNKLDSPYDRIVIGKETFDFVSGRENFINKLGERFPTEVVALRRYCEYLKEASRSLGTAMFHRNLDSWYKPLLKPFMTHKFNKWAVRTTQDVLDELFQDNLLKAVLAGQWGDYGLPPSQSSFLIHALIAQHYLDGACYPVGGASQVARTILEVIRNAGGDVLTSAEVKNILIKNGKAVGVCLKDGLEILCDTVISGVGVFNTIQKLLPSEVSRSSGLLEKLNEVERSGAHLCLYLGLEGTAKENGLGHTNYWVYPHADYETAIEQFKADPSSELPMAYISFPSSKDPEFETRHPGKSTIEVISMADYEMVRQWEASEWRNRPADYEQFKQEFTYRMQQILFRYFPQVKGKIVVAELSTPLTTKHFSNYEKGEIYGLSLTSKRFQQDWLRAKTPVEGLFFTGQDIMTNGIGGALFSGIMTANVLLDENIFMKIMTKKS